MNIFQKYFLPVALLLWCNASLGYNFIFSNLAEKFLVICYKLEGLSQEYYQIIPPDQSVSHYFSNVHCFGQSILWAELKKTDAFGDELPFRGGIDLVDRETGMITLGEMQDLFKSTLANKYAFIPMQIKVVDNKTFQMTANAAQELMRGVDRLACQTIETVTSFMNPASSNQSPSQQTLPSSNNAQFISSLTSPSNKNTKPRAATALKKRNKKTKKATANRCRFELAKIAKSGADLAGVSLCRDLHFVIVDTGMIGTPGGTRRGVVVSRVQKPLLIAEINQGG